MARVPSIPELLAARAAADPDRIAIRIVDGSDQLTFGQWDQRARSAARGLVDRGVGQGERVGLLFDAENWIGFAVAYCAVLRANAVAVPVPASATRTEIDHILGSCAASATICAVPRPDLSGPPVETLSRLEAAEGDPPPVAIGAGDLAQILYTSGTSGKPKGVGASHGNLSFGCQLAPRRRAFEHSEYFLHSFPIGTNAGQLMLLNALVVHPTALVLPRFDGELFCAAIERHAVGTAFLVPAMAIELLASKAYERHDLSSVLMLSSSGSTLPPPVARRLTEIFSNASVINAYTSTEAMPAQVMMMVDPERPDSVGVPLGSAEIGVFASDGTPLPAGETGEVWLRCPTTPRVYYGDPEATGNAFRDDWVRMGDVGRLDDDGHLYLLDRESDVIKSGGMRISTTEVEAALHEHPGVREAAVVGLPHPVMGSMVAAALVLEAGTLPRAVRSFLRGRLAAYKIPIRWLVVDELPRNRMGKVVKRDLRGRFGTAGQMPEAAAPATAATSQLPEGTPGR